MIDTIAKWFRDIISILIVIEIIAVLVLGIITMNESLLLGLLVWIAGIILVIIWNGILCIFLKIEEHLKHATKILALSMRQRETIKKALAPESECEEIPNILNDDNEENEQKDFVETKDGYMLACERCKTILDDDVESCHKCGFQVDRYAFKCDKCDTKIKSDEEICPKCGTRFYDD
ncbi:MAG: zinc ribbon domain-containing protein [Candidatus Cloacimonetes bacterium]|nr:zinc ribbon domain-containing protein [Candidatus Cloacimonadota bacterium]